MSFKILEKKNATTDELAKAFAEIEIMKADLEGQQKDAYAEMVRCQQQAMAGKKGADAELEKAKATHFDLELRVEACRDAMEQIRQRIEENLPAYLQHQKAALEKKQKDQLRRKDELNEQYLSLVAQAAVVAEQIKGKDVIHLRSGEMKESTPDPGFNFSALSTEDQQLYLKEVGKHRKALGSKGSEPSVSAHIDSLADEVEKIERILAAGNFGAEAEKLISSYRPEAPSAEKPDPPEAKRRQGSAHEIDYDAYAEVY